jgi:hypothetical protein
MGSWGQASMTRPSLSGHAQCHRPAAVVVSIGHARSSAAYRRLGHLPCPRLLAMAGAAVGATASMAAGCHQQEEERLRIGGMAGEVGVRGVAIERDAP